MSSTKPPEDLPAFTTANGCRDWLSGTPLTDAAQAHAALLRQINLLNQAKLPADVRFDILEQLREPIHDAQEEFSRRFAGKPLPLAPAEQAAFDSCRALWHGLAAGYTACFDALAAQAGLPAALAAQRALAAFAAEQLEIQRAGRVPADEHWHTLHRMYAAAERLGVAALEVADPVRLGDKVASSPAAAYVEAMLLHAASLHELGQRQIGWAARWARRWAPKVRVVAAPPALSAQAFPLCVDLASGRPAGYPPVAGESARWLETTELRRSLKKRGQLLEQGETPAAIGLGADCTQPACGQLLGNVYLRWCKGGAMRGFERRPASGGCRLIVGVEAVHYYLSGRKPFQQPGATDTDLLRRQREEIATFGRVATHRDEHFSTQHGYAIEEWEVLENWHMVDASATGLRIARPLAGAGARIGPGLLVACRPADAHDFLLGNLRWTFVATADSLQAGVNLFPGRPEAVAVRSAAPGVGEKFRQAFLLPAVPALKQEASIVMPVGLFKLGKTVDVYGEKARQLRLTRLVERGADFERAAYAA